MAPHRHLGGLFLLGIRKFNRVQMEALFGNRCRGLRSAIPCYQPHGICVDQCDGTVIVITIFPVTHNWLLHQTVHLRRPSAERGRYALIRT